jgi:hypothetical protein
MSIWCYCCVETDCIDTVTVNVNVSVVCSLDRENCLDDLSKEYDEGNVKFCVLND